MSRLTKNDNGSWYGYLYRWGDPIPERPGETFKYADRTILGIVTQLPLDLVGASGVVFNVQKAAEEGVLVVIKSDEDLTNFQLTYNLTSDNDIVDEKPYDPVSGEYGYRLRKYPIKEIVVKPVEVNDASTNARPVEQSFKRPKRN
jgi:hypothetical protein